MFIMTPAFNPNDGGVQRTTYKLGKKFTELGHEVSYYSLSKRGNVNSEYGTLFHATYENKAENPINLLELKKVLGKIKPDFVINQMPYDQKLRECLAEEKKIIKYILLGCLRNSLFSVKNNIDETYKRLLPQFLFKIIDHKLGYSILLLAHRIRHKKQLKQILDQHDKFILLTPPNKKELEYFVGNYKQEKVEIIPNSIPFIYNEDIKRSNIILHVGRLNIAQKRSDLLLEIWEMVYERAPNWKFVIIGDGPYRTKMEEIIKEKSLSNVKMLGYQQPEEWYKKASIFVMTSAFEGFPNVILEAQSFGCVPVAFNSYDALPWIVNDKKDAFLINPFDTGKFASKVLSLIDDNRRREKMSEKSKKNVSKFVIDEVGNAWIDLFTKLTNSKV